MASTTKDLPPTPELPAAPSAPSTPPPPADELPKAAGVFRRLTSKLRSPSQQWAHVASAAVNSGLDGVQEEPSGQTPKKDRPRRKISTHMLALPGASHRKGGMDLENAFTSPEQRQAALRAVGLVPANAKPGRDAHGYMLPLSEQEKVRDQHYASAPGDAPRTSDEQESEAQRIKEAWMKKNTENSGYTVSEPRAASRSPARELEEDREWEQVSEQEPEPLPLPHIQQQSEIEREMERERERERQLETDRIEKENAKQAKEIAKREKELAKKEKEIAKREKKERKAREKEKEREKKQNAEDAAQQIVMTEQVRARRQDDPVFAPQGLMEAMQAYRPQNYRPPADRKPNVATSSAAQRHNIDSNSDTDSD